MDILGGGDEEFVSVKMLHQLNKLLSWFCQLSLSSSITQLLSVIQFLIVYIYFNIIVSISSSSIINIMGLHTT